MNVIIDQLMDYLDAVGFDAQIEPYQPEGLTFHYIHSYNFYRVKLLGVEVVAVEVLENQQPRALHELSDLLRKQYLRDEIIVLVLTHLTSYTRKELVRRKISFVVPGTQLFIPELVTDLRETYRQPAARKDLSPSAQLLLLYLLKNPGPFMTNDLMGVLPYTRMTVLRAFRELEDLTLVVVTKQGRDKLIRLSREPQGIWEEALGILKSPVVETVQLESMPDRAYASRMTALTRYSMISEDRDPTFAMWKDHFHQLGLEGSYLGDNPIELELWTYPPGTLADDDCVDPLSLYLSLRDDEDERVSMCLDEMMENYRW